MTAQPSNLPAKTDPQVDQVIPGAQIQSGTQSAVSKIRDVAAVVVGALIVLVFLSMVTATFIFERANFEHVKDVFVILGPFVGTAVGYFIGTVPTVARAEKAEATAKSASDTAQMATKNAETAENKAQSLKEGLSDLAETTENHLAASAAPAGDNLSGNVMPLLRASDELLGALARARQLLR